MWPHFISVLLRIIHGMPLLVSSNWAAWLVGIGAFIFSQVIVLARSGLKEMLRRWKENIGIGLISAAAVYIFLFGWSAVQTIYDEHHDNTGRWRAVVNEKDALKVELKRRDDYIELLKARSCPACSNRHSISQPAPSPETIHDVLAEVRITCTLKDSSRMPLDSAWKLPSEESYLEGAIGKAYLQSRTDNYKREEEEGKVIAIEHFKPPPNSNLIGMPVSEFANYSSFRVVDTAVSGGFFSECTFAEVTLRINGNDVFRFSKAIAIKLDETHGLSFTTTLGKMNLPK
jgi:hypothetical protein